MNTPLMIIPVVFLVVCVLSLFAVVTVGLFGMLLAVDKDDVKEFFSCYLEPFVIASFSVVLWVTAVNSNVV